MIKLKEIMKEFWMPGAMTTNNNPSPLAYADAPSDELIQKPSESVTQDNKDWFMHLGTNDWNDKKALCSVQINEGDNSIRIWAEVKTKWLRKSGDSNSGHHDRVNSTIKKVAKAWASEARRIRRESIVSEIGNKTTRTWKECFTKALESSKVAPYIKGSGIIDPVNFSYTS